MTVSRRSTATVAKMRARGHQVVAPDLPCDDDSAGLAEYADAVVDAVGDRSGVVLVAHSFAGFVAPLVCDRLAVDMLILVAAMIPSPGEPPGDWWDNTRHSEAQRAQAERDGRTADEDMADTFLHDVPPDLTTEALKRQRDQSGTPFESPWPLAAWPKVPTRSCCAAMIVSSHRTSCVDSSENVWISPPDEMEGGHYVAISRPIELADRMEAYGSTR